MDLWDMLRDAQAAQAKLLAEQQRVIDALPREYTVPPPGCCACFEGHCRGVDAIPFGLVCKASGRGGTPYTVDRQFIREADRRESLEAYQRRRETALRELLLTVADAMRVQRALARVPDRERVVQAAGAVDFEQRSAHV